jgi:hypothetical protein
LDVLFPLSETYTINERRLEYKVIHQETDIFIFFSMHLVNCVLVNKIDTMPPINSGNLATILLDIDMTLPMIKTPPRYIFTNTKRKFGTKLKKI